jgi:hypothetical protein
MALVLKSSHDNRRGMSSFVLETGHLGAHSEGRQAGGDMFTIK